jgi:GNAT superfamily N-acetyltransferase
MWRRGDYLISTERSRLDLDLIHRFLSEDAYWSPGVGREVVERSIDSSLPFGVYRADEQVAFARAVTDYATFAWVADVFVVPEHRGRGLGKWLVETMLSHPELQGLRRWLLATADAHGLYEGLGFERAAGDERFMVLETEAARRACMDGTRT